MKLNLLLVLLTIAPLVFSCAGDISDPQGNAGAMKYKTVSFETIATKTVLGTDGTIEWEKGDQISIYYENAEGVPATAIATAAGAGTTTVFYAEIPETDDPSYYYATYPSGKGTLTLTDGVPSFTIHVTGDSCDGSFKQANFAAAYTESNVLEFKNAVGIIKVTLPEGGSIFNGDAEYPITGLYLRCKGTSVNLNGKLVFTPDADEEKWFSASTKENSMGGRANIYMAKLSQEAIASGVVYMPCTPATWPDGVCLRYYSSMGKIPAVLTKDKEVSVKRGHVLPIADFSSKIVWNYYVSPDASSSGTGLSESDPMTLTRLQDEYFNPGKGMTAWTMRLDAAAVNFKKGTYRLTSTLEFPVPASGGEYTLLINGNGAVLDGGTVYQGAEDSKATVSSGGCRVMSVGTYSHIIINDLVLQNGYDESGGGLYAAYSSSSTDANSSVEFRNCRFFRNFSSSNGGSAVCVATGAAGGLLKFDRCVFRNNQTLASQGGAVLYTASGKSAVMFNKCTFHKNFGSSNGSDIYMNNSAARLGMNNCTVTAYDNSSLSNGASITNKGYTVIANTTIWTPESIGVWGCIGLGSAVSAGVPKASVVVSSVVRNGGSLPAFYLHKNYYQNIRNCIYTGSISEDAVQDKTYTIDAESYDAGIGGQFVEPSVSDCLSLDLPYYAYLWNWVDGYPCPSLQYVRQTIAGTPEIGPLFLRWLDSLGGALDTDIAGRPRNENAMCPGSYQQKTTPTSGTGSPADVSLRVMSFNILREDLGGSAHLWTKRKEAALQMLSVNSPVLMGLQECSWTTRQDILESDPRLKAVGVSVFGTESGYTSESSNSIIYRSDILEVIRSGMFWLSDTPDKLSYTWNAEKPRTCTWVKFRVKRTGHEFYHYNAHLHNGSTTAIQETRTKSMTLILSRIAKENVNNIPVIVTGDHNTTESVLDKQYAPAGFRSARVTAPETDPGRTINSFAETAKSVIDHIYTTAGCVPGRFWVDRNPYAGVTYVSDHYPVFCDMTIKMREFSATMDGFQFDNCEF